MNTKNPIQKRAVIYCRVSTKEQVEEGNSLQTQEKICKDYAIKNGYEVAEVFIEQGESAKTAHRTELQKLLSFCALRKNDVSAVIAYKLDRISRNTDDYSQIRLLLKRYGVDIRSTSEYFENTPAGRFMENIIANVAQFDNDVRTERSVGGMKEATREGRHVGPAPLGFTNTKIAGKSNIAQNHLAPLIKKAFDLVKTGLYSIEEVHRLVSAEGLVTKRGKRTSRSQFHKLLRNETYAGWIKKFGERHRGTFEPIVPEATFNTVQNVLRGRKRTLGTYQLENPDFPLRRFIRNQTGAPLTGCWSMGRRKKYPYYRFKGEKNSLPKAALELQFLSFLNRFKLDPKHYKEFKSLLRENLMKKTEDLDKKRSLTVARINSLKEKQGQLIQKNLHGFLSDLVLKDQLMMIEKEILDLELLLSDMPSPGQGLVQLSDSVAEFLKNPGLVWANAPFDQKLRLQWFEFPLGVTFANGNFRTAKICSLFKLNELIKFHLSYKVPLNEFRSNTPSLANFPPASESAEYSWDKIGKDMRELEEIFLPKAEEKLPDWQLITQRRKPFKARPFPDTS